MKLMELLRSIPACAGEPSSSNTGRCALRVYPRVCGGTYGRWYYQVNKWGLSPRVRGNPYQLNQRLSGRRSIPACAGEPHASLLVSTTLSVYPRVCGGTTVRLSRKLHPTGLSPRVRGNRETYRGQMVHWGSIPACAGEPPKSMEIEIGLGVYPRVCGGTGELGFSSHPYWGLSPRVRGNRYRVNLVRFQRRSIPACAGEPDTASSVSISRSVYPRVCGGTLAVLSP